SDDVVGGGGFERPNTGSKVPRLTAWPRPSAARAPVVSAPRKSPGLETNRSDSEAQPQGAARQACPQEAKCSPSQGFLATGRARRSYSARVIVRVRSARFPPFE